MRTKLNILLAATALALTSPLAARADDAHHKPGTGSAAADMTSAEVRKVDLEAGKITLRHAPIKNLDMPAMTMVFVVRDKNLLAGLQLGDKVRFSAVDDGGKYTVTAIERAN